MDSRRYGNSKEDGEWHLVQRRKQRSVRSQGRMDVAEVRYGNSKETVSFYFSDFPNSHGAKEMLRAFALYGNAVEVVIPPKKNKWGKRFGFVRFTDVNEPRIFAVKLDNIIFGANKIHVNLPRFDRERNEAKVRREGKQQDGVPASKLGIRKVWREVTGGSGEVKKSGEKLVSKEDKNGGVDASGGRGKAANHVEKKKNSERWNTKHHQPEQKIVYFRKKNICDVWYNTSKEEMDSFEKMYAGVVKNAGCAHMVQEWFNMQGFFSVKVTPMGANLFSWRRWRRVLFLHLSQMPRIGFMRSLTTFEDGALRRLITKEWCGCDAMVYRSMHGTMNFSQL